MRWCAFCDLPSIYVYDHDTPMCRLHGAFLILGLRLDWHD